MRTLVRLGLVVVVMACIGVALLGSADDFDEQAKGQWIGETAHRGWNRVKRLARGAHSGWQSIPDDGSAAESIR